MKTKEMKVLNKKELCKVGGGGVTWEHLGKVIGTIKNTAVSLYENWMEMPAMPY